LRDILPTPPEMLWNEQGYREGFPVVATDLAVRPGRRGHDNGLASRNLSWHRHHQRAAGKDCGAAWDIQTYRTCSQE
jgi:hypothetical protein